VKATFKRTLKWQPGDVFVIPLADGSFGFAQAIAPVMQHVIDFAFFSSKSDESIRIPEDLGPKTVIGIHATWRQAVTGGYWGKVGNTELCIAPEQCPNQLLIKHHNSIGVTHGDIGHVENFLSACHGLLPWNIYKFHPFDNYLVPGRPRPSAAYELSAADLAIYRQAALAKHKA